VLDGHVILDRKIAERGRYPAIDLLRSVSRSLPAAASPEENALITEARQLLGAYEKSEMMIRAGLYVEGSDPSLDQAIRVWPDLDAFLAILENGDTENSFRRLALALRRAKSARGGIQRAAPSTGLPIQRGDRPAPKPATGPQNGALQNPARR
jgi:flagellum-specific ATP synthase